MIRFLPAIAALTISLFPYNVFAQAFDVIQPELQEYASAVEDNKNKIVIVLDAGHGGTDLGARSSKHILEKNVTLKIAKKTEAMLSLNDRLEVLQARSEERDIPMMERIEFANSKTANLYIGIHADGGMGPRSQSIKIYTSKYADDAPQGKQGEWNMLNYPYREENRKLADALANRLNRLKKDRGVSVIENTRLPLSGLAMPAVMIEPVDLSNPDDEINLEEEKYIVSVSREIAGAIIDYLKASGKLEDGEKQEQ